MPTSTNGKANLTVTPASEWRIKTKRGFVVQLPSGNNVRMVRSLDMLTLLRMGSIPNPLADVLKDHIDKKNAVLDVTKMDSEVLNQLMVQVDQTICDCVIEPKIYMVPDGANPQLWQPEDEDGISIIDLTQEDKNFIYSVAQGGATDLASFREQQKTVVAALANVPGVEGTAKPSVRARSKK